MSYALKITAGVSLQ